MVNLYLSSVGGKKTNLLLHKVEVVTFLKRRMKIKRKNHQGDIRNKFGCDPDEIKIVKQKGKRKTVSEVGKM